MADNFYRYTSNKDPNDGTTEVVVARDEQGEPTKVLVQGGPAVQLSDEEYKAASRRFRLRTDDKPEQQEEAQAEAAPDDSPSGPRGLETQAEQPTTRSNTRSK